MSSDSQGVGSSAGRCTSCGEPTGPNHQCKSPFQALIGTVVDGRYQVKKILGQGGMGVVFLATQTSMNRDIALKMLHPTLSASMAFAERFRREAEVASRLKHPNIISIYDFGLTPESHFYYTMELLEGENLKSLVKRDGPMAISRALPIIEQVGSALEYAHGQKVLHRDMKPHNVMCARYHGKDFVKVLDFGLVKMVDDENSAEEQHLTTTGQILGTPAYMSPEQAAGDPLDHRSDLYSLGVVLYYLLAGSTPFKASSAQKLLAMAMGSDVPPVAERRKGAPIPESLEAFIRRSLAYHRDDRPADVSVFLNELAVAVEGVPPAVMDAVPTGAIAPPVDNRSITSRRLNTASAISKVGNTKSGISPKPGSSVSVSRVFAAGSGSLSTPLLPSTGRSLALGAGIGLGLVVVLGGSYALYRTMSTSDAQANKGNLHAPINPTAPTATAPLAATTAPTANPVPSMPAMVTVKVNSDPPGAQIFDGANLIGSAPGTLMLARSRGAVNLTFKLQGYLALTQGVDLSTPEPEANAKLVLETPAKPDESKDPKKHPPHKTTGTSNDGIPVFE
jgi:serine/threonine-protein kinase